MTKTITSAGNGKVWEFDSLWFGWGIESRRSGEYWFKLPSSASTYRSLVLQAPSNISHNHNLWLEHPALPASALIFSWVRDLIIWLFFFFFFNNLLPCLKRKRQPGTQGWIVFEASVLVQEEDVSSLCRMTPMVEAFTYRTELAFKHVIYQFYQLMCSVCVKNQHIISYFISVLKCLHCWFSSLPVNIIQSPGVWRFLSCSCCSEIQHFVSALPFFWHCQSWIIVGFFSKTLAWTCLVLSLPNASQFDPH